jgi:hypothetical protein
MGPKEIGAMLFLHQLPYLLGDWHRKDQFVQLAPRCYLENGVLTGLARRRGCGRRRRDSHAAERALQSVGKNVMILASLFGNRSLDGRSQGSPIARDAGADD